MAKQILPTTTTLKPRKKDKTAQEKKQRRVERIMRNRNEAQKSRERKRFYLNLYQQKSEKYDLLFDMLMKHNVLESNNEFNNNQMFLSLKKDILNLNSKQKLFEKENGTVNSSVPKRDEDEEEDQPIFHDVVGKPITKKIDFCYDNVSPTSKAVEVIQTPESSTTTLKDTKIEDQDLSYIFNDNNLNFAGNIDIDLELGISLDENILDKHNLNYPLFVNDNESFIMQQRYPAEITS